jgi:ABC-2 type transport system ATP-binding protein
MVPPEALTTTAGERTEDESDLGDGPQLEVEDVGKRYGDVWGVRGVSLDLGPGVLGLLGPNGAGKSTLMRILTTYLEPTEGTVTFDGTDAVESPNAVRKRMGYLPQDFGVYPDLTAREFLSYLAAIRGLDRTQASERIDELLALTNLQDVRDRRLGGFSGGMRQRVGIAQALLTDPDLLVVDEPTVGLDPAERVRFRNVLSSLGDDRVVVLSTHIVSDIEATASEVAVLADGRLRTHATPERLLDDVADRVWEVVVDRDELQSLKAGYLVSTTTRRSDGVHARVVAPDPPMGGESVEPTLEEAYLDLLGDGETP